MSSRSRQILIGLALVALVLGAYAGLRGHGFIGFDDDVYVTENPPVWTGLSRSNLRWAWTTLHAGYWQPLTWLSLQIDAQLTGTGAQSEASVYHLTNLLLHCGNVLIVFGVLSRMTGAVWRSAIVAALFALHPLHVESVAWVTERKDVLSTFFGFLALGAYVAYVRQPRWTRYALVLGTLALSLMAKPMFVTFPCMLLLLDYWPLSRLRFGQTEQHVLGSSQPDIPITFRRALREKVPLFALVVPFAVLTALAQRWIGAVSSWELYSLRVRIANALLSYVRYLGKTVWPSELAVYYPHPGASIPTWQVIGSALLLAGITILVVRQARRRPYLLVGWLWFLGTLVPVIGLMQAGSQAMADRFVYVPNIGLYLAATWGLYDLLARWRVAPVAGGIVAAGVLAACLVLTVNQIALWRDAYTIWEYTLGVTENNALAHTNFGGAIAERARALQAAGDDERARQLYEEAGWHYQKAVELAPGVPESQYNLAEILYYQKKYPEAIEHYRRALQLSQTFYHARWAHYRLGELLLREEQLEEARTHFTRALEIDPGLASAYFHLGTIALRQHRPVDAVRHFTKLVRLERGNADAHHLLGLAYSRQAQWPEAVEHLRQAAEMQPETAIFHYNLAFALCRLGETAQGQDEYRKGRRLAEDWLKDANQSAWRLATTEDPQGQNAADALYLALQVCEATEHQQPEYLETLAAAHAAAGQFPEAVAIARVAQDIARKTGQEVVANRIQQHIALYEQQQPIREPVGSTPR